CTHYVISPARSPLQTGLKWQSQSANGNGQFVPGGASWTHPFIQRSGASARRLFIIPVIIILSGLSASTARAFSRPLHDAAWFPLRCHTVTAPLALKERLVWLPE